MGTAVLVISGLCYLTFIGATTPEGVAKGATLPLTGLDAAATAGETVYLANGCSSCHMIKGVGAAGPGPELTNEGAKGWDNAKMIKWLKAPLAPMPSFASLPPEDLDSLATFVNGLGTKYK